MCPEGGVCSWMMIDQKDALTLASASSVLREGLWLDAVQELREGWFFPLLSNELMAGCNGVIVNKQTGKLFHLGSAFPLERDLELYDRGYQFELYDLVILEVHDREQTRHALGMLGLSVVEPQYEHGVVWRIPRDMTNAELAQKLEQLPCIFSATHLYFKAEQLEQARRDQWFTFETREHLPPASTTTNTFAPMT